MPVLRGLADGTAFRFFAALHVPLVVVLFRFANHPSLSVQNRFRLGVDIFAIVHVGLHALFEGHPDDEFDDPLSKLWIRAAGTLGAVHATSLIGSAEHGR